tara:strand:- start:820 stop:969 length:150 start_codon:yes stop_codon:yes gene_type:complete
MGRLLCDLMPGGVGGGGREITPCPDSMKKRTFVSQRFPDIFWPYSLVGL